MYSVWLTCLSWTCQNLSSPKYNLYSMVTMYSLYGSPYVNLSSPKYNLYNLYSMITMYSLYGSPYVNFK